MRHFTLKCIKALSSQSRLFGANCESGHGVFVTMAAMENIVKSFNLCAWIIAHQDQVLIVLTQAFVSHCRLSDVLRH